MQGRHQTSVKAGTILDKTRTPLTIRFEAGWHLTTAKNGLSAKTLEWTLGASYRTAWAILQQYRVVLVRSERERLCGERSRSTRLLWGGVKRGGKRERGTSKSVVVARGATVRTDGWTGYGGLSLHEQASATGPITEAEVTFGQAWSRTQGKRN